jgi:hypothetical protein
MMEQAIMVYKNGDTRVNAAPRTYNVPKETLQTRVDGSDIKAVDGVHVLGDSQIFQKK